MATLTQISPTTAALFFLVDDAADATLIFAKLLRQEGYGSRPDERVTSDLRALGALVKFKPLWADDILDSFAKSLTNEAARQAAEQLQSARDSRRQTTGKP